MSIIFHAQYTKACLCIKHTASLLSFDRVIWHKRAVNLHTCIWVYERNWKDKMSLLKESVKGWWQANRFHLCCFPEYWALGWAWGTKHLGLFDTICHCGYVTLADTLLCSPQRTFPRDKGTPGLIIQPQIITAIRELHLAELLTLECWCTFHSTLSCFHPANILKHNYFLVSVVLYWWVAQCICGVSHNKGHNLIETHCAVSVSYKWWTGP